MVEIHFAPWGFGGCDVPSIVARGRYHRCEYEHSRQQRRRPGEVGQEGRLDEQHRHHHREEFDHNGVIPQDPILFAAVNVVCDAMPSPPAEVRMNPVVQAESDGNYQAEE